MSDFTIRIRNTAKGYDAGGIFGDTLLKCADRIDELESLLNNSVGEYKVGDYCYAKFMSQHFKLVAIDGDMVWLKSNSHYLTTSVDQLEKEKTKIPLPENGVK